MKRGSGALCVCTSSFLWFLV